MVELTLSQLAYASMIVKSIADLGVTLGEVGGLSDEECDKRMELLRQERKEERDRLDSQ